MCRSPKSFKPFWTSSTLSNTVSCSLVGDPSSRSRRGSDGSPTSFEITRRSLRSSWTLCMELRQGVPFATAYKTVVSHANVAEALARYLPPDSKGKGGKGELKGRFKTNQSEVDSDPRKRPGPYRPGTGKATGSQATGQGQQQGAPQCRLFAAGHCKFGSSCKFAHGAQQPPHHAPHKPQPPAVNPAAYRDSSERPHGPVRLVPWSRTPPCFPSPLSPRHQLGSLIPFPLSLPRHSRCLRACQLRCRFHRYEHSKSRNTRSHRSRQASLRKRHSPCPLHSCDQWHC